MLRKILALLHLTKPEKSVPRTLQVKRVKGKYHTRFNEDLNWVIQPERFDPKLLPEHITVENVK